MFAGIKGQAGTRRVWRITIFGFSLLLVGFAGSLLAQSTAENVRRGMEAFRQNDFDRARQLLMAAARQEPRNANIQKLVGMAFAAEGKSLESIPWFESACRLNPKEDNACYYLGRAYYSESRFEDSRKALEIALRFQKPRGRVLLGLALTLEGLGENAESERFFKEAIREGEQRALIDFGRFLHKNGRGKEAIEYLKKANAQDELEKVERSLRGARSSLVDSSPLAPVRFKEFPLPMVVKNGAFGNKHLIETMIAGVAVLDYDRDGLADIFVANGADVLSLEKRDGSFHNRLFHNEGNLRFADVTEKAGLAGRGFSMGAAVGDYDNDGYPDLFVTGVRGNQLYRNRGNGSFEDVTSHAGVEGNRTWAVDAAFFDYDNDGWLDLFVTHYVKWDPAVETYCGERRPGYRSYCHPRLYEPLPNALFRNLGDGTFRDVSVETGIAASAGKGMGMAVGDYDRDGRLDVFIANDTAPNFLFHNLGKRFEQVALEVGVAFNNDGVAISSMGADFRDFDNDGYDDLFVTALSNEMFPLFRNRGDGMMADVAGPARLSSQSLPYSGWSNGMYDFNNDGWKDLFTANGHVMDNAELTSSRKTRQPSTVFLNRGDGTFEVNEVSTEAMHRGAAFGDFDNDGRIDAVVTRLNEAPVILQNVSPNGHTWIEFSLEGRKSNRDAIGALVGIETGEGWQWNRVTRCVGYSGSSDAVVHFGIRSAKSVKRVRVEWPSGLTQEFGETAGGKKHQIKEPQI